MDCPLKNRDSSPIIAPRVLRGAGRSRAESTYNESAELTKLDEVSESMLEEMVALVHPT